MLCAFAGSPQILRLYCRGRVVTRTNAEWATLLALFPQHAGARQIIIGDVEFVQTSCGYAVPEMVLVSERDQLRKWTEAKGEESLVAHRRKRNLKSIDGLSAPTTDG